MLVLVLVLVLVLLVLALALALVLVLLVLVLVLLVLALVLLVLALALFPKHDWRQVFLLEPPVSPAPVSPGDVGVGVGVVGGCVICSHAKVACRISIQAVHPPRTGMICDISS